MSEEPDISEDVLPESIKGLIPDVVESEGIPAKAKQVIEKMKEEVPTIKDWAQKKLDEMDQIPTAKVALNGIFRHPPEFTEEEWDIIIAGLKANLPLYRIALKVHCERHFLAKKIAEMKEVAQLVVDSKEGLLDEMEYQLKRCAEGGSLSAIMFYLQHQGQGRGWGDGENNNNNDGEETFISLGVISDEKIAESKRIVAEANKKTTPTLAGELAAIEAGGVVPSAATPQELAAAEDFVKAQQAQTPVPAVVTGTGAPPYAQQAQGMPQQPPYPTPQNTQGTSFGGHSYDYLESAFDDNGGFTEGGSAFGDGW